MATKNSIADLMLDWEKILAACADNATELTTAEPQRAALEAALKEARDLRGQRDSHQAAKQRTQQQLNKVIENGREAVRRLQGGVKLNLGTDNEQLVQFNIPPRRKRGGRKTKTTPPPTSTPPPSTTPPAGGTPQTSPTPQTHAETK
jgi:hypothetical protein